MKHQTTLIHISDIHFGSESTRFGELRIKTGRSLKRVLGWINAKTRRRRQFPSILRNRLIDHLKDMDWDYLVISGDITNLALEKEFHDAREKLRPLIAKGPILLSPGNHDRYVPIAYNLRYLEKYFGDCFPFNPKTLACQHFHILEIDADTILIELDLSIPRWLLSSRGRILTELDDYTKLIRARFPDRLKIAVGHYPAFLPPDIREGYFHSLEKSESLRRFLIENEIHLYLHGHLHKSWTTRPDQQPLLTCVNSGGCCRYEDGPWAGFHKITINRREISCQRVLLK
jgi:3',5'-cyclic AMP phosphodiesterase CpdA